MAKTAPNRNSGGQKANTPRIQEGSKGTVGSKGTEVKTKFATKR